MFPEGRLFEFLIAAVVALIVVGPKDLPILLRKFGQFMAKVRAMAAEFRASFDEMARQSELDDLRKEVEAMRKGNLADIAASPEMTQTFNEIHQGLTDVGVDLQGANYPYVSAQPDPIELAPSPKARKTRKTPAKTAKAPAAKRATAKTTAPRTATAKAAASKAASPKAAAKSATKTAAPKAAAKPKLSTAKAAPAKPRARKAAAS
jgi:sec-independent protein translocase protein TatB